MRGCALSQAFHLHSVEQNLCHLRFGANDSAHVGHFIKPPQSVATRLLANPTTGVNHP